jgi:type I restriction enzyme M protein
MGIDLQEFSRTLFAAANQLWTNTALRPDQYAQPVLALIALRQMEAKFEAVHAELAPQYKGRLKPAPADYQAKGAIFLPENARFSRLLSLPGTADLGAELNAAMKGIADANPDLAGALPQGYQGLPNDVLQELLRLLAPLKIEGDAYGLIFEYFMGQFASSFMQKGGEYFTPASIVKLIVEIIEPYHGTILDPACGSGGMFVHSAEFVRRHHKSPSKEISIYGVEKMSDTLRICRMNLAVHGLSGDIREANSYYDDPHKLVGRFDFVMANPPFNQSEVDRAELVTDTGKVDARFPLGLPTVNNANYIWINLFHAALSPTGRAGFVMANSAADAGGSERELRMKLVETGAVERRAAREDLTEDELAVFDLLTKPKPKLSKAQEAAVKKVARDLLEKLQEQLSVEEWQAKQQTRAAVQSTIRFTLNELPEEPYPEPLWNEKVDAVWAFIFARRQASAHAA